MASYGNIDVHFWHIFSDFVLNIYVNLKISSPCLKLLKKGFNLLILK